MTNKDRSEEMAKCGGAHCKRTHQPNDEATKVLKETDRGENLIGYESLDDFWEEMGFVH